jgi:hypothetical protein
LKAVKTTHATLCGLRKALANVVRSALRNEKIEAADELTQVATELEADAASSADAAFQPLTDALAACAAAHGDVHAALVTAFDCAAALFAWEMDDRARYSALLTRARLESVATFMENDAAFRNQFSPAVLASLHDANNVYRKAMVGMQKSADVLLTLCKAQSAAQQGWIFARQRAAAGNRKLAGAAARAPDLRARQAAAQPQQRQPVAFQ